MSLRLLVDDPSRELVRTTFHGFQAIVLADAGYRWGFIQLPAGHPWHGLRREEIPASCHGGGISYSSAAVSSNGTGPDGSWWIGFDCIQFEDAPDPTLPLSEEQRRLNELIRGLLRHAPPPRPGTIRTTEFCLNECRRIAEQALEATGINHG